MSDILEDDPQITAATLELRNMADQLEAIRDIAALRRDELHEKMLEFTDLYEAAESVADMLEQAIHSLALYR